MPPLKTIPIWEMLLQKIVLQTFEETTTGTVRKISSNSIQSHKVGLFGSVQGSLNPNAIRSQNTVLKMNASPQRKIGNTILKKHSLRLKKEKIRYMSLLSFLGLSEKHYFIVIPTLREQKRKKLFKNHFTITSKVIFH